MSRGFRNAVLAGVTVLALSAAFAPHAVQAVDQDDYWTRYWDGHWQGYRNQHHGYYYGTPATPYDNNPYLHAFPQSSNNGYPNMFYYQHPHFHYTRSYNALY